MTYKEFDAKYNRHNMDGVITYCSVIDTKGNIIFAGTPEEVDDFTDQLDIKWYDDPTGFMGKSFKRFFNGIEVFGATNLGESCFDLPRYKAKLEALRQD